MVTFFSGFSKSSANIFLTPRWNLLIYLFMQLLWYIMSFAHGSTVPFKNMSFLIEIRSFQQPVSYLWGLVPKSFRISLAFNMVTNDTRFVSRICWCYCSGSFWSGNRRRQWWKIRLVRLSFRRFNCVTCFFRLVRTVTGFDVISYIDYSILINICN